MKNEWIPRYFKYSVGFVNKRKQISVSAVSSSAGAPPHSGEAPLLLLKVSEQQAWRLHVSTVSTQRAYSWIMVALHCQPLFNPELLKLPVSKTRRSRKPFFCRKMILNNYLKAVLNLQMIKCFSICTGVSATNLRSKRWSFTCI